MLSPNHPSSQQSYPAKLQTASILVFIIGIVEDAKACIIRMSKEALRKRQNSAKAGYSHSPSVIEIVQITNAIQLRTTLLNISGLFRRESWFRFYSVNRKIAPTR